MSFQILQRAYAPYGTAAQFPASGDPRLIYRATDTGYLYTWDASESAYKLAGIDPATVQSDISTLQTDVSAAQGDISTLQGDVATLTQGIADAVSTHNAATDAHADIRTLVAGKQDAGNYAGSSTPGGAATTALACTGNAATATTAADSSKLGGQLPSYYSANGHTHAQSEIDSSAGWITTALAGKQAAGSYLTTTGTAADSAKLGGVAASGYSQTSHTHNYAGSSTPGGAATTALACTGNAATATTAASCTGNSATATTASSCSGNAATATKWATARSVTLSGVVTGSASIDGSADATMSTSIADNALTIAKTSGLQTALGDKVSVSATGLGRVGNVSLGTLSTPADWANLPVGCSRMYSGTTATGFPGNGYWYVTKVANRDVYGGYCVMAVDYSSAATYMGRAGTSEYYPTWTGPYLTTTGTAADSAKLGGVAASGYSQTSHTHNYAGSSSAGGAATTALECTGNAATATALATARTLTIGSTGKTFDGSANVSWTLAEMEAAKKPSSGTWTPVLTADTPPTEVILQYAYADFFTLEGWCWFTFGFQIKNPGTGGAGRIKISGLPETATSAYTPFARPQFAVNHNAVAQLYQIPPSANYIYATSVVPQYQTLTAGVYIEGQGFFKIA